MKNLKSAFAVSVSIALAAGSPALAANNSPEDLSVAPATELQGLPRLLAMEDMKNLRLTFCRSLDNHNWAALRATMADNFELHWTDTSGPNGAATRPPIDMQGADKFITFAQQILSQGKSIHICTMPQFVYVGRDRARALWFINGYGQIGEMSGMGYERVVEDYVRVQGKWRIRRADANIEVQTMAAPQGAPLPLPKAGN